MTECKFVKQKEAFQTFSLRPFQKCALISVERCAFELAGPSLKMNVLLDCESKSCFPAINNDMRMQEASECSMHSTECFELKGNLQLFGCAMPI